MVAPAQCGRAERNTTGATLCHRGEHAWSIRSTDKLGLTHEPLRLTDALKRFGLQASCWLFLPSATLEASASINAGAGRSGICGSSLP